MYLINQQLIKDSNLKLIYLSIYANRGISRTGLAKLTRLSKTTVSSLVDELIERRFIIDTGVAESDSVGRKPNSLLVRTGSYYTIVINWVEDKVHLSLMDIAGTAVYEELHHLEKDDSYISLSQKCIYNSFLKKYDKNHILGLCVTVSAMIDAAREEIYSTTLSLPASGNINLIRELSTAFPEFQVALLEDTACYAYAEKVYTDIREKNFAFINFGRGIGATLFIEGHMIGKASGAVTQFGHYSVDPDAAVCVCGNHGCLEALWSESCLKDRIRQQGKVPSLATGSNVTFTNLGKAALYGDMDAQNFIISMADDLARALSNLICIVNPSMIILGGKCPALGSLFLSEVRKALPLHGFRKMVDNTEIRYSRLEQDSYLNGAMKYFFDTYYSFTSQQCGAFYIG